MKVYTAPDPLLNLAPNSIFLAGSIEMGKAKDWQQEFIDKAKNYANLKDYCILNPRRKDWDPKWVQEIGNDKFYRQVKWELDALEKCTIIVMNLIPGTISPISLLEFGLYARSGKLAMLCPNGFHRKGNVDIVCEMYSVPTFESMEEILSYL